MFFTTETVSFIKLKSVVGTKGNEKITIVVASSKTAEEKRDYINMLGETVGYPADIVFIGSNKESLTNVYQKELDQSENEIIIFVHDDVEFLTTDWGKRIVELFKQNPQFGIIGVAGSRTYGNKEQIGWWMCDDKEKRGLLFHGDSEKSWITFFSEYTDKLMEVAVIDGVFMAVNREKLEYDFDTDIQGFHFYDIDFCVANFLSRRCRIGVTNKVCLRHKSPGRPNGEWLKNGFFVREKYKDKFPIKVFR